MHPDRCDPGIAVSSNLQAERRAGNDESRPPPGSYDERGIAFLGAACFLVGCSTSTDPVRLYEGPASPTAVAHILGKVTSDSKGMYGNHIFRVIIKSIDETRFDLMHYPDYVEVLAGQHSVLASIFIRWANGSSSSYRCRVEFVAEAGELYEFRLKSAGTRAPVVQVYLTSWKGDAGECRGR